MRLTIANVSTQVSQAHFDAVVAAIQKQVTNDFQPEWGKHAALKAIALSLDRRKAPVQDDADAILYLGDSSEDPTLGVEGAEGYHCTNHKRIPYGFVYLDICKAEDTPWTVALSHEVLELLGDPDVLLTVCGTAPKGARAKTVYYDLEVCDPTEGDVYRINDVQVSNFVGRRYFGFSGGSGKTNHLGLPLRSLGVRPGGYLQYEEGSRAHVIWGRSVTDAVKAAKKKTRKVRRNGRRSHRLNGAGNAECDQ
jgi:hypothetical protein